MEKRIIVPAVILSVVLILAICLLVIPGRKNSTDPLKIIPADAAIILKIKGFGLPQMLQEKKSLIWSDLSAIPAIAGINAELQVVDTLLKEYPELYDFKQNAEVYITGHITSGKKLNFLCIIPLPSHTREKTVLNLLQKIARKHSFDFSKRKLSEYTVITIANKAGNKFNVAYFNGLLIYSREASLIDDAIVQATQSYSLADDDKLKKILNATGKNKDANLFIDLRQIGKGLALLSNQSLGKNLISYTQFGNWTELDITVKDELIIFNGFTQKSETNISFLSAICSAEPVNIEAPKILPSTVSCFFAFGLSDPELNYSNFLHYLGQTQYLSTYKANLKNLNDKYGIEFDKFFLSLLSDEIVLAYNNKPNENNGVHFIVFKCKSGTEANKALISLTRQLESKLNSIDRRNAGSLMLTYSPDKIETHTVFKLPIYPLFGRLLGDFFNVFDENYLTVIDNYIIVAGSYNDLTSLIYDCMLQKTLINDEAYKTFDANLSPKSYLLCYTNLANSRPFYEKYFNESIIDGWKQYNETFEKSQSLGLQFSKVSNNPYISLFVQRQKDNRGKPHTIWESKLDTSISLKPKFVLNHITQENEIFLQDNNQTIYLLNQSGRILWKVPLNEAINSEIYQIDYYKNGKLQLLFSTANYIHLIDRNGNYVERYPLRLRSSASAGLALFDYENDKNYRLFIPCTDKKVYAYSSDGTLIPGWEFSGSDYAVTQSVNHFRIDDKDFIVFGDDAYTYILDRKGEQRVKPSDILLKSKNNNYCLANNGAITNSYLVITDTSGTVCKLFFDGKIEKQQLARFSAQHFFDFKDINADGANDYIFLDNNTLQVYRTDGSLLFEKKLGCTVSQRPIYFNFSYDNRKIGLVSTEEGLIYLINKNGELYKGFPLEGTTLFSIGYFDPSTNRFNLIVGGRNNFLYNYAVE